MGSMLNRITRVTRRNIFDYLRVSETSWSGGLDEVDFLGRIWNLNEMLSQDSRYDTAERDIVQHRVYNYDWDDDWVLSDTRFNLLDCADDRFLTFLSQTIHPVVRSDETEVKTLVDEFNRHLRADGFVLARAGQISGRVVYGGFAITATHAPASAIELNDLTLLDDPQVLQDHLDRVQRTITEDPPAAIGAAKELVESTLKVILDKTDRSYKNSDTIPALYKKVAVELRLDRESVPESVKGSQSAHKILGTFATTSHNLAELRNQLGLGHGRSSPSPALERHARLAFNTAVVIVEFLLDTWHARNATH